MTDQFDENRPAPPPEQSKPLLPAELLLFSKYYVPIAKALLTSPVKFYESMPQTGSLKEPLIFASVGLGVQGLLGAIFTGQFLQIPMVIIWTFACAAAFAGLSYGLAVAQGGKGSFLATARIVCYASVSGLLAWIPLLGLLSSLGGVVLIAIGLKTVHKLSKVQAAAATVLPMFFIGGMTFLFQLVNLFKGHH